MNKLIITAIITLQIGIYAIDTKAQDLTTKNDTWYVWIETEVPINNEMVKVVSKEPMTITCCLKSAKYRRFVQKTAKWLTKNISAEYNGELELHKIQDLDLANEMILKAKQVDGVKIIDYSGSCN